MRNNNGTRPLAPAAKRCSCDMTAVVRTVQREGPNQGRQFWTCPNSEKARCGFFEWVDEAGASPGASGNTSKTFSSGTGGGGDGGGGNQSGECYKVNYFLHLRLSDVFNLRP